MSQHNTTWEINGVSFELDMLDADTVELYENCIEQLGNAEKTIRKDGKHSEFIRAFCDLIADFFDSLFGEGASDKIFAGKKISVPVYLETYDNFLEFAKAQNTTLPQLFAKYTPNRQQRRASKKK